MYYLIVFSLLVQHTFGDGNSTELVNGSTGTVDTNGTGTIDGSSTDIVDGSSTGAEDVGINDITVKDITKELLVLLRGDGNNETVRLKELRDKVQKVESYSTNMNELYERILNETRQHSLNETSFYNALNDQENLPLANNQNNLYLQIKSRMNRDDMVKILSEKGVGSLMKSARRSLDPSSAAQKIRDQRFAVLVDQLIAELPNDQYIANPKYKQSNYWDPKPELEERHSNLQKSRRIYKGERTNVRSYPFMVSVQVMGRFWCGGVLYWYDLVITSAACLQLIHNNRFYRENPKTLAVRVGSNHSRLSGEVVEALEVYFHPGYNPKTLRNNIALIRLQRVLNFDHHRVPKIIDISHNDEGITFTSEVLLLGWGLSKISQKLSYDPVYLQRKILPIYPNDFCKEIYGPKFISRTMFCAGTMTTGEGACDHDAGGPAIMYGKLVGVISFGPSVCGYPGVPTVLTLVGAYADWIETVNESIPSYVRGKVRTTTTTEFPLKTWPDYQKMTRTVRKRFGFKYTTRSKPLVTPAPTATPETPDAPTRPASLLIPESTTNASVLRTDRIKARLNEPRAKAQLHGREMQRLEKVNDRTEIDKPQVSENQQDFGDPQDMHERKESMQTQGPPRPQLLKRKRPTPSQQTPPFPQLPHYRDPSEQGRPVAKVKMFNDNMDFL